MIVTEREEAMDHLSSIVESNTVGKSWQIQPRVLDWTLIDTYVDLNNFDIVIGADIIYIEDTFAYLLQTLLNVAGNSETLVLLSCRIRYKRDKTFLNLLKEHFEVERRFYDEERKIFIYNVRKKV